MTESVNMIVMGDWGGVPFFPYYSPFEIITAKQMIETAAKQQTDFILALGDNFYYNGVVNEYDSRFMVMLLICLVLMARLIMLQWLEI